MIHHIERGVKLIKEKTRQKTKSDESGIEHSLRMLQSMPSYDIFRYHDGRRGYWRSWANNFFTSLTELNRAELEAMAENLVRSSSAIFTMEALWDFSDHPEKNTFLAEFFKMIMERLQSELEPEIFAREIIGAIRNSSLPRDIRYEYTLEDSVPSDRLKNQGAKLERDIQFERRILLHNEVPEDIDDLIYVLKSMAKGKMGLPIATDFLYKIKQHFYGHEEWEDIEKAFEKLEKKQPEWYGLQSF